MNIYFERCDAIPGLLCVSVERQAALMRARSTPKQRMEFEARRAPGNGLGVQVSVMAQLRGLQQMMESTLRLPGDVLGKFVPFGLAIGNQVPRPIA